MLKEKKGGFKKLVVSSFDIQFTTNLAELAKTIGASKKCLRRAYWVRRQEKYECEIVERKKLVKRTFIYGFRKFVKKESHKDREILAPHPDVQAAFKAIQKWLEKISFSHPRAYGFVKNRNPKKAVQALMRRRLCEKENKHFLRFDIEGCFPSTEMGMVESMLEREKIEEWLAILIAWFGTAWYSDHGDAAKRRLPQGSSCSPALLNRVYKPMCRRIDEICKKHGIKNWAVYADDFNFAASLISDEAKKELLAVPAEFGFKVKDRKTRDNFGKTIPHILGLTIVRGEIHLSHKRKSKFRRILYAAAKGQYSHEHVMGIVSAISQIYGKERNWPGWLLKPWQKYQLRKEVEVWMGEKATSFRPKT